MKSRAPSRAKTKPIPVSQSVSRSEPDSPRPVWALRVPVIALGIAFLLGLLSTEIADPDFWWHLKTGEYIATRHALPVPDPFAYTTDTGRPAYPGELTTRK